MARTKNRDTGTTALADKTPPGTEMSETFGEDALEAARAEAPLPETPREGASPAAPPTYDEIARRAYELYQQRGGTGGQDWDDWLRAEAELRDAPGRREDET